MSAKPMAITAAELPYLTRKARRLYDHLIKQGLDPDLAFELIPLTLGKEEPVFSTEEDDDEL